MKPKVKILLAVCLLMLAVANVSEAALVNCKGTEASPCGIKQLIETVTGIINFLLSWAWLVAVLMIVWAGLDMVYAGGNEEKITSAKTTFRHAVIGFFLIMISFVLLNSVVTILSGNGLPRPDALLEAIKLVP